MKTTQFDFETLIPRGGNDAKAIDAPPFDIGKQQEGFDLIPMWIADMSFPTAPAVVEAIEARLKHPLFGYFEPREAYYERIIQWQETQNGLTGLTAEHINYENSGKGAIVSAVQACAIVGESILLHTPAYLGFTKLLKENGYQISGSPLVLDENQIWRMDYKDMEARIIKDKIRCCVFCSPHNPTGRVWEKEELEKAMALFEKHDVTVISDEIWADLVLDSHKHVPCQMISEDAKQRCIAIYAPSKTFNLAGLVGAYRVIFNKQLAQRVEKQSSLSFYNHMNVLTMHGLIGAYSPEGQAWASELRQVLSENMDYGYRFFKEQVQDVFTTKPQGTYLLFLDCEDWCKKQGKTLDELLKKGYEYGVLWQDGRDFGGDYTIRLNLALPKFRVEEALTRLKDYVFKA